MSFHMEKNQKQTPENKKSNNKQKQQNQKAKQKEPHITVVEWSIQKLRMKRSDQAAYVPRPERVILEATAQSQTFKRWPEGAKQKSRSAETQDPPSQDPGDRITKPCRHNKHQCTSNASICLAVWKDMRVKRKWNGSETYRVKRTQQQHLQATQSPLMCALAIIIHIPSHSIAEGQCQCTRFSLPNLVCSSQVSCATHRRTDGYVVTEKVLLQLKSDSVCHQTQ